MERLWILLPTRINPWCSSPARRESLHPRLSMDPHWIYRSLIYLGNAQRSIDRASTAGMRGCNEKKS
jgi:hypothetical protein